MQASHPGQPLIIRAVTKHSELALFRGEDGRLYQLRYGGSGEQTASPEKTDRGDEFFFPPAGNGFTDEPALQAVHADGNTSADLVYVRHEVSVIDGNVTLTRIELKDPSYPFFVTIFLKCYFEEDIIEQWHEVLHREPGPVTLRRFASSSLTFKAGSYWLSQFHGDWNREAALTEEQLTPGIKVLDSKLGVRAHIFRFPSFMLSLDGRPREEAGESIAGSLRWSGSFQLSFEVDSRKQLRAVCGMSPFGSDYRLQPGETFAVPPVLWSYSASGKGQLSRNFHAWARRYGIRGGEKPRPVLLNNWEATYFDFDENIIVSLFDRAKEIGVELFLLDDGWFANKYPREHDRAGLGDWEVNRKRLPHGLGHLAAEAKKRGIRFGIWIEPEMVNPKSELFEEHPDWVISQPHRELQLSRHQLILDLCRPETKEYAWSVVDGVLGSSPDIAYVKWDCNRYVTQPGSPYLKPEEQTHLFINYTTALYDLMGRMADKYPGITAMVCSGGGGRVDYGALKYFHSFWPSDNTDPAARVFIQWGYSQFFPAATIAAHITRMNRRPLKFAADVALSGALGLDMDLGKTTPEERQFLTAAIGLYKNELRQLVQQGDLYRLESPYEGPRSALSYVTAGKDRALLFVYQLKDSPSAAALLRGLDPAARYVVREMNLPGGTASRLKSHGMTIDGKTLMAEGIVPPCEKEFDSAVIELKTVGTGHNR